MGCGGCGEGAEGAEDAEGAERVRGVQRVWRVRRRVRRVQRAQRVSEAWGYVGARAAKAVDGLIVVAHRGQRDHAARRQQLQQLCSRGAEAQRYWRRRDADAREAHVWWEQTCNCRSLVSCVSSTKMCE